jgi:small-conductance mechanosensitive channel
VDLGEIRLIGLNAETATKLLLTLAVMGVLTVVRAAANLGIRLAARHTVNDRWAFWGRQGVSLSGFVLLVLAFLSIWFDDPTRLASVVGFAAAGLAIAAQRAVTAFAGYLVIMRGRTFTVGDRITIGGVHGDVIALGFLQTRILEMGQPPEVNAQDEPGMWVRARQFTGRIVTVTNDKLFDEPVYNFTREFPFIWEEMHVPIPYRADRARAERILRETALAVTADTRGASDRARDVLQHRYGVQLEPHEPCVFWRLTDNWLDLTVRFVVPEHGVREIKDAFARRVLAAFDEAGIEIASTTIELTRLPRLVLQERPAERRGPPEPPAPPA